ncbi:GNAT family N-acetyltransferase [Pseudoclavibacter sp. 8L]|uniref:GNAT family N-acetyltransferase n=1 Tax=Pseudoclavibacter sp. 8L TaxID=2653162 RepID=UPI0012EF997C|nr:GNAT family N-acetyltransferase [Pseudoclavibacter sp. 8L]VXB76972.1 GNAT family N-acetyltransferase [Pseudoclavibacter sp. 8L]
MTAADDFARHPIDPTSQAKLAESGLRYETLDTDDAATFNAWARADLRGFLAAEPSEKQLEGMRASLGYRRTTGVWDDSAPLADEPIATVSSWPADLTLPGGSQLTSWAISSVTVSQARRRRGIARNLLEGELRTAVALGLPLAALTVSESTIYGRFGFGPATFAASFSIDTRRVRWAGPTPGGRVDYVGREKWAEQIGGLFDRVRVARVGEIEGWDGMWPRLAGTVHDEDGDGKKLRAITYTSEAGDLEGAALFKLEGGDHDYASHTLNVEFLRAVSDDAYAALWRFFLEADLVATVKAEQLAIDEPIRWMLGDQRAATVTTSDHQWLRILDTKAVLDARRYSSPGVLGLEIEDALGFAGGSFVLTVDADGVGTAEPVDALPEGSAAVRLRVDALGSLVLGGVSPAALRAAGSLHELSDGAAELAGRVLRVSPEPSPGIWY